MTSRKAYSKHGIGEVVEDISRGITTQAYRLHDEEGFFMTLLINTATPGAESYTDVPLPAATEEKLIYLTDGNDYITNYKGEDFVYKLMWLSHQKETRFRIYRANLADYTCEAHIAGLVGNILHPFTIGWTRGQLEDININSIHYHYIKNVDAVATSSGKIWIVGFRKQGRYDWY